MKYSIYVQRTKYGILSELYNLENIPYYQAENEFKRIREHYPRYHIELRLDSKLLNIAAGLWEHCPDALLYRCILVDLNGEKHTIWEDHYVDVEEAKFSAQEELVAYDDASACILERYYLGGYYQVTYWSKDIDITH